MAQQHRLAETDSLRHAVVMGRQPDMGPHSPYTDAEHGYGACNTGLFSRRRAMIKTICKGCAAAMNFDVEVLDGPGTGEMEIIDVT